MTKKKPEAPKPHRFYGHQSPYRVRLETHTPGPSMTKESFAEDADINNIVDRYHRTGILDAPLKPQGAFLDVSDVGTYRDTLDKVREAQEAFESLPAAFREQFDNDARFFHDYALEHGPGHISEIIAELTAPPAGDPPPPPPNPPGNEGAD